MLRPPVGVALLGFVALMAGFAYLIVGLRYSGYVVFGRGDIGEGLLLWGLLTLLVGIMFFVAAFALWATQPWGWLFAHFLAIFGLIEAVFVMLANNSLTDGLAVALFPLLVLWYLNDREVKGAFGLDVRPPSGV
jgi:cytochrome c oxidase subunit IV